MNIMSLMSLYLIEPTNGLCNRLRSIASGYIYSKRINRDFKVYWKSNADIGYCEFTDLFEPEDWLIDLQTYNKMCDASSTTVYVASKRTELVYLSDIEKSKDEVVVLAKTGGNYWHPDMSITDYNREKSEFYNSLKPVKCVLDKVEQFIKQYDLSKYIGVHIRRGDRKDFTPKTDAFVTAIRSLNYMNVLLCTDDSSEYDILKEELPEYNIVQLSKSKFGRDDVDSIRDALVEWYLLGMCDYVIYSHSSSFGYEACVRTLKKKSIEMRSKKHKTSNELRNLPPIL